MITFLSGGTGTPKLLRGFREILPDEEIAVIVNTAEDLWISGNHLSPDVDTLTYLFAGILDTDTWWGIRGDTFVTHHEAEKFGAGEYIAIGDRDRAVHIARGEMLRKGKSLTGATREICRMLGVGAEILPMSDTPVSSMVKTAEGWIHFQEFWIRSKGTIGISAVTRKSESPPVLTPEAVSAIRRSDAVIVGPSNPVTSILPILECRGTREELAKKPVIAVSPFIGDRPVSGPAYVLMMAAGMEPGSASTYDLYREFADIFIQDERDTGQVQGTIRMDTLMTDVTVARRLAGDIMARIPALVKDYGRRG